MAKHKLVVDYEYEFTVWGIVSSYKEHKIAWEINNSSFLELAREPDIQSSSTKTGVFHIINFKYETENSIIRLLKNKLTEDGKLTYLVPELKHLDYLLIIDSQDDTFQIENLYHCLLNLKAIEYLKEIDIDNIKSKQNLIF